uniref:Glucuronosyltransferase n=1 Tax=Sinocyclocheilus grahami TaxID=75366 RepID=A0A672LJF8_SINGR
MPNIVYMLLPVPFLSILSQVFGGKVLVYPSDGSHWVNMKVLIEELHTRGHNVTLLRASNSWYIKEESPFYTSITVYNSGGIEKELLDAFTKHILVIRREKLSFWTTSHWPQRLERQDSSASLHTAKYDLVLTDPAFGGGVFLARHLGLPLVLNVRWTMHGEAHYEIALSPLSFVPGLFLVIFHKISQKELLPLLTDWPKKSFGGTPDLDLSKPGNKLLVDWLPQNDLLGHPQTKVFITHRGTNGIQEAIYHGVPILGLPIVFDQPDNLSRMKVSGTAKLVDIAELNRTMFLEALEEVLYNPSYKENMQRLSKLHHDQPMKPLDLSSGLTCVLK